MCAAGLVGFLPENTHLMYLNFPCVALLSTLQHKPHQIYETKTLTPFGIQPARQKSQALQVVPVQRPEDRCRCLFDGIYYNVIKHTKSCFPDHSRYQTNERAVSLLRVASFMQHSSTPVFPQCLDPWLGYPLREGFPPPLYSHRVSQHMADQLRESISSSSQAPNPHFGDLFGFF